MANIRAAGASKSSGASTSVPTVRRSEIRAPISACAEGSQCVGSQDHLHTRSGAGGNARATMAARALRFNGALGLMNTQVPWSEIAKNRAAAHQLEKSVPGAYGLSWEVYKLRPDFAQAVRIALLQQ